jgi:hypothetical protein
MSDSPKMGLVLGGFQKAPKRLRTHYQGVETEECGYGLRR